MKYIYLCLIFSYLSQAQELQIRTQAMMGTFVTLTLPIAYISKTFKHIKVFESVLSSYDSKALVYQLNHQHEVISHPYLQEALLLSKEYYKDTHGYFDITIGSISKDLYHFGEENETIASLVSMQNASLNINGIYFSDTTISTDKNISIDLGGMGKGYIVDKVALFLQEQNISKGVIALSGDIRCLDLCDFELQSPYSEESFVKLKSTVAQLSISTSGTYRRYIKDKKYHHLLNPKIASQGQDFISVSLFSVANNSQIDAYATAISVMPKAQAYVFLEAHSEIGFILVESRGKIVLGNYEGLVEVLSLDSNDSSIISNKSKNTNINNPSKISLIQPYTKILTKEIIKSVMESLAETCNGIFVLKSKKWLIIKMSVPMAKMWGVATSMSACRLLFEGCSSIF